MGEFAGSLSGGKKKDAEYYKNARKHAESERHKSLKGDMSNRDYAKKSGRFLQCCEAAGVDPTPRQASKYRNSHGAAYAAKMGGEV